MVMQIPTVCREALKSTAEMKWHALVLEVAAREKVNIPPPAEVQEQGSSKPFYLCFEGRISILPPLWSITDTELEML